MNRDAMRYRAWRQPCVDGIEARYFYDVEEVYDGNIEELGWFSCFGDFLHDEEFILEQCTGLKDKNNKLIYANDIVQKVFSDGSKLIMRVCYDELKCKWLLRYDFPFGGDEDAAFWDFNSLVAGKLEVIGNIHEIKNKDNSILANAPDTNIGRMEASNDKQ